MQPKSEPPVKEYSFGTGLFFRDDNYEWATSDQYPSIYSNPSWARRSAPSWAGAKQCFVGGRERGEIHFSFLALVTMETIWNW